MATSLRDMARERGLTLAQLGVAHITARSVACGQQKAGPSVIARIAETLGLPPDRVAAVLDAAWNAKHPASPTSPVGPGTDGTAPATPAHAAQPQPAGGA